MKKILIVLCIGLISAFSITACSSDSDKNAQDNNGESKAGDKELIVVKACDVLTEKVAKEILGEGAKKSDLATGDTSSDDINVSNCIYSAEIDPGAIKATNLKGVSILARSAKTSTGAESNKAVFDEQKPSGVTDVDGIGDDAYFNPEFGQLNVLKGNNWYIVTNYVGSPTKASLEDDKTLAEMLTFK